MSGSLRSPRPWDSSTNTVRSLRGARSSTPICVLGVIALVVWDLVDESAQYTTVGVIVLLVIAIAVRPGGLRGPRRT